jgi:hypothetical protein
VDCASTTDEVRNYGETNDELLLLTDAEVRPERHVVLGR